ncbi:MAG: CheB methylesterase [Labilithrix sp.]|nr:CheB methylesterase [Labilithrix sp.]
MSSNAPPRAPPLPHRDAVIPRTTSVVVVGSSAGGLHALEAILGRLPADFPVPVVAVQHRARASSDVYASLIGRSTKLPVREIDDDDALCGPGVYLAPPDYHVLIEPGWIALSIDEPVSYSRPSIDVLFESAADAYGAGVVGVLLTGANADGAKGLARIKQAGGIAIVQDPATAESPEMPTAGIAATQVDCVAALEAIAGEIVRRTAS